MSHNFLTGFFSSLKRASQKRASLKHPSMPPGTPAQRLLANPNEPEISPNALALKLGMRRVEAELILKLNRMMSGSRNNLR